MKLEFGGYNAEEDKTCWGSGYGDGDGGGWGCGIGSGSGNKSS